MSNVAETNPIVSSATVTTLVTAILVLLVNFGLPISDDQRNSIINVVAIVAPLAVIWWPAMKTTPLANPQVTAEDGKPVSLIRSDTGRSPDEAIRAGNAT